MSKLILISIDGMRPDGLKQSGFGKLEKLKEISTYTFNCRTTFPPVTLPCHMSMFYGVNPDRHGIVTNTYRPQVRQVMGIYERVERADKISSMYYGWDEIKNVSLPGCIKISRYINAYLNESVDTLLTEAALADTELYKPDFVFLYLVDTDDKGGHDSGWMTDKYLSRIRIACDCAWKMVEKFRDEYSIIITADHGGHNRDHGDDIPEDMIVPMFCIGKNFKMNCELQSASILDVAPTIAEILEIGNSPEWEGKSLCN